MLDNAEFPICPFMSGDGGQRKCTDKCALIAKYTDVNEVVFGNTKVDTTYICGLLIGKKHAGWDFRTTSETHWEIDPT